MRAISARVDAGHVDVAGNEKVAERMFSDSRPSAAFSKGDHWRFTGVCETEVLVWILVI